MQTQNIKEYQSLRREIDSIKKCVTDYMGFLIIGMGAAFSVWGGISAVHNTKLTLVPIAYSSLAISLVALFMLFVLMYKFISHNRYVGYCVLLTHELWDDNSRKKYKELILWEVCVNLLRMKESSGNDIGIYNNKRLYEKPIEEQQLHRLDAIVFLVKSLFSIKGSSSWGFPVTIIRIFTVSVWSCVFFSASILSPIAATVLTKNSTEGYIALMSLTVVVMSQLLLWTIIAVRFHSIMKGKNTITGFANRFYSVREQVLNDIYNIHGQWIVMKAERINPVTLNVQ